MSQDYNLNFYFYNLFGNKSNFDTLAGELHRFGDKFSFIGLAETNVDAEHKDLYKLSNYITSTHTGFQISPLAQVLLYMFMILSVSKFYMMHVLLTLTLKLYLPRSKKEIQLEMWASFIVPQNQYLKILLENLK